MRKSLSCLAAALLSLCAMATPAHAEWPDHPVHIVVPFPPGNSSDVSMRLLAERLTTEFGQSFIVDNRTGAGGTIGTGYAARAAPDGYTLAMGSTGPMTIARALKTETITYDAEKDFVAVGAIAWAPQVMIVRKDFPASNFQELLAYSKKPGVQLSFGTSGVGTTPHLVISSFLYATGIQATHIPYRGGVQTVTDLLGGQLDFISDNVPVTGPPLSGGQAKAIGVTSGTRIPSLPDIPTLKEQGVKDFDLQGWILLLAPSGTPEPVRSKLNAAVDKIMKMPDVRKSLNDQGLVPMDMTREQLKTFVRAEVVKWERAVKISGAAQN